MIDNMPPRNAFGDETLDVIKQVYDHYKKKKLDFGYQGDFEKQYTDNFVSFMGGKGYADAVCTGTASLFVALASLQLEKGSHVIVSAITDPGTINAVIFNQLVPVLADNAKGSYNMGVDEFESRISDKTKAAIIVHAAGKAAPISEICEITDKKGIHVIEDCSQAHGATYNGKKVGLFGELAAFSTMYRKAHCTGGCGGIIFTPNKERYDLVRSCADRGKPFSLENFDDKDPSSFLFPALNFNIDELSCAIGMKSLLKLKDTIRRRLDFLWLFKEGLEKESRVCRIENLSQEDSPFFQPVIVDASLLSCEKTHFAAKLQKNGAPVNPDYRYVVGEWPWVKPYLSDNFVCKNAIQIRDSTFNLLLNENYGKKEVDSILEVIRKVEDACLKI